MPIHFDSARLTITGFEMGDADDLFACISPAIARFMPWEPPRSVEDIRSRRRELASSAGAGDFSFVIRARRSAECLGAASIDGANSLTPEIGIWLKEAAHGLGYAGEAVRRLCEWAAERFDPQGFIYPVAAENLPSRRVAERLGGVVTEHRTGPKYASVVYLIPRPT